jgi:hypothetical protein
VATRSQTEDISIDTFSAGPIPICSCPTRRWRGTLHESEDAGKSAGRENARFNAAKFAQCPGKKAISSRRKIEAEVADFGKAKQRLGKLD